MDRNLFSPDMVPIESVGSYVEKVIDDDSFVLRILEPLEKRNMELIKLMQAYGMPEEAIEEARDAEAQSTEVLMCLIDELSAFDDYVVPRCLVDIIIKYGEEPALRELVHLLRERFDSGAHAKKEHLYPIIK